MKKNSWNSILLICIYFVVLFSSCKTIKNTESGEKIKVLNLNILLDSIKKNNLATEWLKGRGYITIKLGEEKQEIDLNIRIKKDSLVWVNLSKYKKKIIRSSFDKDSVKIVSEYPEKLYFFEALKNFEKLTKTSLSYSMIEELFYGGTFIELINNKLNLRIKENQYFIKSNKIDSNILIYECWINPISFRPNEINLYFTNNSAQINIKYRDWEMIEGNLFPLRTNVVMKNISNENSIEIIYKNLKFDIPHKFPSIKFDSKYQPFLLNE